MGMWENLKDWNLRHCGSSLRQSSQRLPFTLPSASGPFGREVAKLATPPLGKASVQLAVHDWVCFLISSNLHLCEILAGWYFQSLNGGGKEGRTAVWIRKCIGIQDLASIPNSLLGLFFFYGKYSYIFFQGVIKSCWKIGNPSLSQNSHSK